MATIQVRYKKREWATWIVFPARDEAEAARLRQVLRAQGYQVE